MTDHEINRDKRKRQATLRLPGSSPKCGTCGCDNPLCLEAHHVAGRRFDDRTVVICRNCHRILSDWQKDQPQPQSQPPTFEECLVHVLLGAADLLELLVEMLRSYAKELLNRINGARNLQS